MTHVASAEDPTQWLNHLPATRVIEDRTAWLVDAVRGRSVVHVGFADVGCEVSNVRQERWIHGELAGSAAELVGLDVSPDAVNDAVARGFVAHVVDCADPQAVQALGLARFDDVVLGEVIEHVDAPGGLIASARELVSGDGRLIVTTPNARRLVDTVLAAFRREIVHPDHVAIYSVQTLRALLVRHGWEVVAVHTYANPPRRERPSTNKDRALRVLQRAARMAAKRVPYLADGLIIVAKVAP